jgi:hypothetical protein
MARIPSLSSIILLAGLLLVPAPVSAQSTTTDPYSVMGSVTVPSPYWGYSSDPYSGYMYGAAAVIKAQAEFMISREQAALIREQVRSAKIDNRKKELEHWAWEREFTFNAIVAERERIRQYEIDRSRTDPPLTDILSASALNNLLGELKKLPDLPAGVAVPVDPSWLPRINVTSGIAGNVGLLKMDEVEWPMLLERREFGTQRQRFEKQLAQCKLKLLEKGRVPVDDYVELRRLLVNMYGELQEAQKQAGPADPIWTPSHFYRARRCLSDLNDALTALEEKESVYFLQPLRGQTVSELVAHMRANGLKFAPATRGSERQYAALHQALAKALSSAQGKP